MPVLSGAAVVLLQESEFTRHDIHLAMIFLFIIALALVVQAIGVLIGSAFVSKLLHRVDTIGDIVEQRTGPMLDKTNALLDDLTPKIRSFTENADQISYTVRAKVDELGATVSELNDTVREINGRARVQVSRVDGIVTEALTTTEDISRTVQQGIKAPVRQIAGVIAGLRAGIETLIERSPFGKG
jgi:uncharacterized protein YoxC